MTKYKKQDSEKAEAEIKSYFRRGLTYHQAAKIVAEHSPISVLSLRSIAYRIATREGIFSGTNLQHRTRTRHGYLLNKCKERLEIDGYRVLSEQNMIRKFVETKGSKGSPDLVAIKDKEILLVEVIERAKASATFIDQLERYSKIGKLIVVLPINTTNILMWGIEDMVSRGFLSE
jgi:hypothetical protein